MTAHWIDITADGFSGYLSQPPTGRGPGIVLLQEIWGVNEHIRAVADQYAQDGYVVLAPDLFWRLERRVDLAYDEAGSARARQLLQTVAGCALLFLLVLALTQWGARLLGMPRGDRIASVFCGSKKTLASGVPMAHLIFGANPAIGLILLPIMIYHPLQLLAGGMLAQR